MRVQWSAAFAGVAAAWVAQFCAAQTSFFPLPNTVPFGMSGDGATAVGYISPQRAFRWQAASGVQTLPLLPGTTQATALDASWDGGSVLITSLPQYSPTTRAYLWRAAGGMSEITAPAGQAGIQPTAVSYFDEVVCGTLSPTTSQSRAFRWTASGGFQSLPLLPTGQSSLANDISGDGSVVVGFVNTTMRTRAFRWTEATGMVDLGFFPGGTNSYANAVSSNGQVIVGHNNTATQNRASRWTEATGMVDLGALAGHDTSVANDVSGDGSVVVGTSFSSGSSAPHTAFIWTPQAGMRPLYTVLTQAGINLSGWQYLSEGFAVSDDGLTITGVGSLGGFVATIPAPGALTVLLMAAPLARRSRRPSR